MATAFRRGLATYALQDVRDYPSTKMPAGHQDRALAALHAWQRGPATVKGGVLVLPTGGGKTFTATRYLTVGPLTQGHKVLWLAHTHHLLDQAFEGFGRGQDGRYELGHVGGGRASITVRTVSGTTGHGKVSEIKRTDDIVIVTLQTLARAMEQQVHAGLRGFLKAAVNSGLTVVFDECHHAPAPSFRRLIEALRAAVPELHLLGLTATPTYTDERRQGQLAKLFPQGLLYQVSPQELMATGVLARPRVEEPVTSVQVEFPQEEYQQWIGSYRDIPEHVIEHLARNRQRNAVIADTYAVNRAKYGPTIMFADRWYQCTALVELLRERGVRAGAIFTHRDADLGSPDARNGRSSDENEATLKQFRRGELDVLVNIRMLTEGTDVPKVQSVFLTRQTTSRILLTQMIGRALRGPRFVGTSEAYIVAFIDEWKQHVNWARWDDLVAGPTDEDDVASRVRLLAQTIGIELVERLARDLDLGTGDVAPFISLLPLGWYAVNYDAAVQGARAADTAEPAEDDVETVRQLVPVYDQDETSYHALFQALGDEALGDFEDVDLPDRATGRVAAWTQRHFGAGERLTRLEQDVLSVVRHRAQNGQWPRFSSFDARDAHDIDALARTIAFTQELSRVAEDRALREEYAREDRLWVTLYRTYDQFKRQYDQSVNRLINLDSPVSAPDLATVPETFEPPEVPQHVKKAVKRRDGKCRCCGSKVGLQVDHIQARYVGGTHDLENLQTLCRTCNRLKGTRTMNFLLDVTPCRSAAQVMDNARSTFTEHSEQLEFRLRRIVNFGFECSAVFIMGAAWTREKGRVWTVTLREGNDPAWIRPVIDQAYAEWSATHPDFMATVASAIVVRSATGT